MCVFVLVAPTAPTQEHAPLVKTVVSARAPGWGGVSSERSPFQLSWRQQHSTCQVPNHYYTHAFRLGNVCVCGEGAGIESGDGATKNGKMHNWQLTQEYC